MCLGRRSLRRIQFWFFSHTLSQKDSTPLDTTDCRLYRTVRTYRKVNRLWNSLIYSVRYRPLVTSDTHRPCLTWIHLLWSPSASFLWHWTKKMGRTRLFRSRRSTYSKWISRAHSGTLWYRQIEWTNECKGRAFVTSNCPLSLRWGREGFPWSFFDVCLSQTLWRFKRQWTLETLSSAECFPIRKTSLQIKWHWIKPSRTLARRNQTLYQFDPLMDSSCLQDVWPSTILQISCSPRAPAYCRHYLICH